MASKETGKSPAVTISKKSQEKLLDYVKYLLLYQQGRSEFRNKMDCIDQAYARYEQAKIKGDQKGMDTAGKVECGIGLKPVVNPIVISNVQSMVSYWSETYLSGYPIFPVVSDPSQKESAEALEGILQDHMTLTAGDAELQLSFNDAAKYNLACIENDWAPIPTYNPSADLADFSIDPKIKVDIKYVNKLERWDLRNTFFDPIPPPSKVSEDGEFIGNTKPYNRVMLKRLLNVLTNESQLVHTEVVKEALTSTPNYEVYEAPPNISEYLTPKKGTTNWDDWAGYTPDFNDGGRSVPGNEQNTYFVTKVYARIIPSDFQIAVPFRGHPQIWKLIVVNGSVLISAQKLNTAQDKFPALLFPAIEDGMELQTQGYAEMTMPIQDATTRLFNARFQSAKRAIADRALYNADMIRPSDINSPNPSAKIAVRTNALLENPFGSAYQQIPFDMRGTEGLLQDAVLINSWQDQLTGINSAGRGQFQKGNKTLGEFQTVMGNSDNKARLSALVIDRRCLSPIKEQQKLNLYMFGQDTTIIAPRTGKLMEVSINELIAVSMQFEVADGYTPKSKMANTEMLMGIMNLIGTSPVLQQVYGTQLPAMLAHLAQLGGIRGFDRYADAALHEWEKNFQVQQSIQGMMQQLLQRMGADPATASQTAQQAGGTPAV